MHFSFKNRKVHSDFRDNIWGADLVDMQLICKFSKGFRFLLCVIGIYSKYAWVISLRDKKGITITNVFQKNWNEAKHKSNKIWVDKSGEFYNRSIKSFSQNNHAEMYLTQNERKPVLAERFMIILKNKIHKYITSVSKNT